MAYHDPRLLDPTLLRLAAYSLHHGVPPLPPLPEEDGLYALLRHAELLRQRDLLPPRDPAALEAGTGPFAQLLREARAWTQREQEGRA
jgi:hypothetical protein